MFPEKRYTILFGVNYGTIRTGFSMFSFQDVVSVRARNEGSWVRGAGAGLCEDSGIKFYSTPRKLSTPLIESWSEFFIDKFAAILSKFAAHIS